MPEKMIGWGSVGINAAIVSRTTLANSVVKYTESLLIKTSHLSVVLHEQAKPRSTPEISTSLRVGQFIEVGVSGT
jgi:hypothetical protein